MTERVQQEQRWTIWVCECGKANTAGMPCRRHGTTSSVEVVPQARIASLEAELERVREALSGLVEAAAPYHDDAAPHEDLWSQEDYRNFNRLSPVLAQARSVLPQPHQENR